MNIKLIMCVSVEEVAVSLGEMIRNARLSAGMSARELARAVGLSHSYISQVEVGGITAPSPGVLKKIACELSMLDYRRLLVSSGYISRADELGDSCEVSDRTQNKISLQNRSMSNNLDEDIAISDKGDLIRPTDNKIAQRIVQALSGTTTKKSAVNEHYASIPVVGAIPAGSAPVCTVSDTEPLETVQLPSDICGTGPYFGMRVIGDSMIDDGILDRDIVIIDKGTRPNNGDICAVQVEGEYPTIKRVMISNEFFILAPANSAYSPAVINVNEVGRTVSIIGRVVHCSRSY
jgi:SOS-response transcriptional repressor LexA